VFHLFGHPSDLDAAVRHVHKRFPKAPIHLVSFSAGNGLVGSYVRMFCGESGSTSGVRSCIMLMGGEDYNRALKLRQASWMDGMVESRLLSFTKNYFLKANEAILKEHNSEAYAAALSATSLHDLYLVTMRHFSGYSDLVEAERRINGFLGGNDWWTENQIPSLCIHTSDDPVGWQLHPEWLEVACQSPQVAIARFRFGSHCACYEGYNLSRWSDRLVVEWLQAAAYLEYKRAR
ncbi:unnamed protein product, partial [Polarella glacialis]